MPGSVSVAFSTYNQAPFVREALESVLGQDHEHAQVVVFDDGSDDGTPDVIREVLDEYDGPFDLVVELRDYNDRRSALLGALQRCDGDWIVRAHGDDVSHHTRVSRLLAEADRLGVSMVTSNAVVIDEQGEALRYWRDPEASYDCSLAAFARHGQTAAEFGAGLSFHRRVWDEFGPKRKGPRNSDGVLSLRALLLDGAHFDPEPTLLYRQRAGQTAFWSLAQNATSDEERVRLRERKLQNAVANAVVYIDLVQDHLDRHPDDAAAREVLPALIGSLHSRAKAHCEFRDDIVGTGDWML